MHKQRAVGDCTGRVGSTHAEDPIEIFTDASLSLRKEKVEVIRLQGPSRIIGDRVIHKDPCYLSRAVCLGIGGRSNDLIGGALRGYEFVADTAAAIVCLHH